MRIRTERVVLTRSVSENIITLMEAAKDRSCPARPLHILSSETYLALYPFDHIRLAFAQWSSEK